MHRLYKSPSSLPDTLSAQAYSVIRSMIIQGEIAEGTIISETELARHLKMSRTPVREALARLGSEGWLDFAPGRGFVVVDITPARLIDAYAVRERLDGLAAETASLRRTRVSLAVIEDLYDQMKQAHARQEDQELVVLNRRFHDAIAEASGNAYLRSMLAGIGDIFDHYRARALGLPGRRDEAHHEHGELVAALREQRPETARQLAEDHVRRALEARRSALNKLPERPG